MPIDAALQFVGAINAQDVERLAALMTEDHRFVDSRGDVIDGMETALQGWNGYFRIVPDYRIYVRQTLCNGETVVLLGTARGTYTTDGRLHAENVWETPAAWRAVIREGRVAEWQVYADNEPIRQRITASAG